MLYVPKYCNSTITAIVVNCNNIDLTIQCVTIIYFTYCGQNLV